MLLVLLLMTTMILNSSDYFVNGSNNSDAQGFITWSKQQSDQINDNKYDSVNIASSVDSVILAGGPLSC